MFRWLLLIGLMFSQVVWAQHPYFYTINDENGLPSNEVYEVAQDHFGYIWIGCDAGLFRYDGFHFQAFEHPKQNSKSISKLIIDKSGDVWCQNFTGQLFCVSQQRMTLVTDVSKYTSAIQQYTIDHQNRCWVITDEDVRIYAKTGQLIQTLKNKQFSPKQKLSWADIDCGSDGTIYLISFNGELFIQQKDQSFRSTQLYKKQPQQAPIFSFFKLANTMYILEQTIVPEKGNQFRISSLSKHIKQCAFQKLATSPNEQLYGFHFNQLGSIFKCTSNGVVLSNASFKNGDERWFKGEKIASAFVDREGNAWFTSLQNGIFVIPNQDVIVYNNENSALVDNNCYSILPALDRKQIFIGTYSGDIYSIKNGSLIKQFDNMAGALGAVRKMMIIHQKLVAARRWITIDQQLINLRNCRDFFVDNNQLVFIASDRFGYVSMNDLEHPTTLKLSGGKAVGRENSDWYFATDEGLFRWSKGKLTNIRYKGDLVYGLAMQEWNKGLYLSTVNHGLLCIKNGQIEAVNTPGLSNHTAIKSFYVQADWLAMAVNEGLYLYNKKTKKHRILNRYDGIAYKEINAILIQDETVFLATIRGVVQFPTLLNSRNPIPPSIGIDKITLDQKSVNPLQTIEVDYTQKRLTIAFSGVSWRSRGQFTYQYRLIGFDQHWRETEATYPFAIYTSLPAGEYQFEVIAVNEDGIASHQPSRISISVNAPFWQRWWFYVLLVVVTSVFVALLFQNRLQVIRKRAALAQQLTATQLTALKAQMNPHFMFNALNSIQSLVVQQDIKNSNKYLSKFSQLMRLVLNVSGKEEIVLQEEIKMLQLYLELEKLRFGTEFNYSIIANETLLFDTVLPPMIVQPYVENAIKHGLLHQKGPKSLIIEFFLENDQLICIVQDNGIGRTRSTEIKTRAQQQHQSFAQSATEKRLNLLKSMTSKPFDVNIYDVIEDNEIRGTKVVLRFAQQTF